MARKSEIKDGVRVMTEDGAGTAVHTKRIGGECYPTTHVPVRLDTATTFCGEIVHSLAYPIRKLRII